MLNSDAIRSGALILCTLSLLVSGCASIPGKPEIRDIRPLADDNGFADIQHLTGTRCRQLIHQHTTMQNIPLGCANQLNLEAMVERPADLQRARPMGDALAQPVAQGVMHYLAGEQKKDDGKQQ